MGEKKKMKKKSSNIKKITDNPQYPFFVKKMKVGDLNKNQCSYAFLQHNLPNNETVWVKCFEDGTLDLRGKKNEYRFYNRKKGKKRNTKLISKRKLVSAINLFESKVDEQITKIELLGPNLYVMTTYKCEYGVDISRGTVNINYPDI